MFEQFDRYCYLHKKVTNIFNEFIKKQQNTAQYLKEELSQSHNSISNILSSCSD